MNSIIEKNVNGNKLEKILEKISIDTNIINKINKILEKNNELSSKEFFAEINNFINTASKIYKKYGNSIENKQKFLEYIFENIKNLFIELNIKRVHNNSSGINPNNFLKDSFEDKLSQLVYIKNTDITNSNIKGSSCNYWVLWFYDLIIKKIIDNDSDSKIYFSLNKDNHGKMYIELGDKNYMYENERAGFKIENVDKNYLLKHHIITNDINKYIELFENNKYESGKISFGHNGKKLGIYIEKNKLCVKLYDKKDNSKNSYFFDLKKIKNFEDELFEKIPEKYHNFLKIALEKIDKNKLEKILNENILLIFTGKSGAGKTTLRKKLEEEGFEPIITYATREPRSGEQDGYDYNFISKQDFEKGDFVLVGENQNGDKYGIKKEELLKKGKKVLVTGKGGIDELDEMVEKQDLNGKNLSLIYLDFSNFTLIKRLFKRGDEKEEIRKRLKQDNEKFCGFEPKLDTLKVFNGDIEKIKEEILDFLIKKYPISFIMNLK